MEEAAAAAAIGNSAALVTARQRHGDFIHCQALQLTSNECAAGIFGRCRISHRNIVIRVIIINFAVAVPAARARPRLSLRHFLPFVHPIS